MGRYLFAGNHHFTVWNYLVNFSNVYQWIYKPLQLKIKNNKDNIKYKIRYDYMTTNKKSWFINTSKLLLEWCLRWCQTTATGSWWLRWLGWEKYYTENPRQNCGKVWITVKKIYLRCCLVEPRCRPSKWGRNVSELSIKSPATTVAIVMWSESLNLVKQSETKR